MHLVESSPAPAHAHAYARLAQTKAAAPAVPGPAPAPAPGSASPCQHCASFFTQLQSLPSDRVNQYPPWSLLCSSLSPGLVYSRRRGSLAASAAAGCGLCQVLLESAVAGEKRRSNLKGWEQTGHRSSGEEAELHFEFVFETDGLSSPGATHTSFGGSPARSDGSSLVPVLRVSRLGTLFSGTLQFDVATEHGDPLAEPQPVVAGGDCRDGEAFSLPVCSINADRGTPEELALVKSWMDWCDNGHRACVRKRRALPSRVLDVSGHRGVVRLVDSQGVEPEPYATLSYCWGKARQPVVTTTATLSAHMEEGVEVARLPRTLQDAVTTARALGLRYLWIDSLCIIQDDPDDKEHEMARMQQVFQNSHVTIVAARARSCHEGFFQAERSRSPLVKLPVLCASGQVGHMLLLPRKQQLVSQPTREPLHERAWALQEIVLSPRLLIYGRSLAVWRCTAGERAHDCSSTGRPSAPPHQQDWNGYCAGAGLTTIRLSPKGRIHQPRLSTHSPHSMFTQQSERVPRLFRTWKLVVHDYTTRALSAPADKLPALAGIAAYFRDAMDDVYLAGLWEKHLLHELSWHPATTTTTTITLSSSPAVVDHHHQPPSPRRPHAYRAPSWTWMSVDAPIAFQADACSWYEPVADVVCAAVAPARPDAPFSQVAGGSVTLNGCVRPNVPSLLSPRTPFAVAGEEVGGVAVPGAYGTIWLDVPPPAVEEDGEEEEVLEEEDDDEESGGPRRPRLRSRNSQGVYWCFMLARCFTRTPAEDDEVVDIETVWGLALALNGDEFERVGYFVGGPQCRAWFEAGGRRDVTIV